MLGNFQFNALSRGNQCPSLPYKKACRGIFGGFSLHQLLAETLLLVSGIEISLTTICILQVPIQNNCKHHIFSTINQEYIYTSSRVAGGLNFNSYVFQRTQRLPSRSTLYVPNPPSPWDTTLIYKNLNIGFAFSPCFFYIIGNYQP